jgi:3-oxoadipate enol-lactonase
MPFADLPNVRLRYTLSGPVFAPVLVLSNSLGTDYSLWDRQAPEFAQRFRLLRYDMRGHGRSSAPPPPYSVAELADDLVALVDSLSIGRFHFCGLSVGGMIGMTLGLTAPDRLLKLVLSNTAPKIGTPEMWSARIETVRSKGMKEIARLTPARWFTPGFQSASPDSVAATMRVVEALDPEGYIGGCCAVRDFDARGQVGRIGVPTLVISGTHDPAAPAADGRAIAGEIRGSRYVELDASHLSNLEQAERYTAEVLSFLEG